jgi:hypothetical protein
MKPSNRRARKRTIKLPGGETAPARTHAGRPPQEDARKTMTDARIRTTGIIDKAAALDPLNGTEMGLCIGALTSPADRQPLTDAWAALSASWRNYRVQVIGATGNPKCASIAMVPDAMQTDPSLRIDDRTAEERIAAAKRSKAAWDAKINALPAPHYKWALRGALDGFMGEATLWRDGVPTRHGNTAVDALRRVCGMGVK